MAYFELIPHPDMLPKAALSIRVLAERSDATSLKLRYEVSGEVGKLRPIRIGESIRTDGLWKTTCFEAFVSGGGDGYFELNFSPSSDWASYCFDSYRNGMRIAPISPVVQPGPDHLYTSAMLSADIDFSSVTSIVDTPSWRVGLSAVIEEESGSKSYWALAHAPGKPDFHNADCFTARLAAPELS
ncbi:hypothetical protein BH10PSE14_BH10PSE14_17470 [soil metagenome]